MEQTANTMPAAASGQYKGLAFTRRVRPVSEKAVEADIANLTRVHAPFVPTDAPAARGMRVTLDFEGFLAGAPIPDSRMEKVTVALPAELLAQNAEYQMAQLRAMLAVRAIAEAEKITVTQQEADAEIARLSKLHDTPEEEIRKVLSRDAIAAAVTNQKVQRFLLDHAALTSVVEKE